MKDGHTYESLPLVYTVQAIGAPKPVAKWLLNGKEVQASSRVHMTTEGNLYKLAIDSVEMSDAGKWQCEITNNLGAKIQNAELNVTCKFFIILIHKTSIDSQFMYVFKPQRKFDMLLLI